MSGAQKTERSETAIAANGRVDRNVSDLADAIRHATEVADREGCTECGQQHRQLSYWLTELQEARLLLPLYREMTGRVSLAKDARIAMQDMRCFWGNEKKLRIAMDLPEKEGRAFLGR